MKFKFNTYLLTRSLIIGGLVSTLAACGSDNDEPIITPTLPVANTAPSITSTSVDNVEEGSAYSYTFTATDAEGDALTYSATTLPTWLEFDAVTGALTGTPTTADVGDSTVTLEVTDSQLSDSETFTITVSALPVVNTPPTITSDAVVTGTVGVAYSYMLTATDVDNDDTLDLSSITLPTWGDFDASTGVLSGTPDVAGSYDAELMVSDGTDSVNQAFTIVVAEASAITVELVVFENAAQQAWAAWINDGGSIEVVTDDAQHDQATKFTLTGPSVAGFTARDVDGAVGGMPFDASAIASTGSITFELKMLKAPDAGVVDWKLKVEGAGFSELSLSASIEGHATPLLDTWQTYTFPISALTGLDPNSMDLFMVFPNYNDAAGAEYLLDNVKIINDTSGGDTGGVDLTATTLEDFEGEIASYTFNNFEGGVSTVVSNPDATGINTSTQVVKMEKFAGQVYGGSTLLNITPFALPANSSFTLTVWSTRAVDILFKLEGGPVGERTVTHSGSGWEELSFDFTGVEGAGTNGITFIFDNGTAGNAEGDPDNWTFYYDDIVLNAGGDSVDTAPVVGITDIGNYGFVTNGGFESGNLDSWLAEGAGDISAMQDDMGTWLAKIVASEAQNPSIKQSKIGEGVITNGQALTVSFDMKGTAGPGGVVNALLFTEASTGVSKTDNLMTVVPTEEWQNYSFDVTAGDNTEWGVTLLLQPACGAVEGCQVTAYFDNVSITAL